jgi:hypothetical protein
MEIIDCCICLEPTSHTLECKHYTCVPCIKRHIKKSILCPICRQPFNITPYKYVPPRHTKNLKLTKRTIQFFNRFLSARYLLKSNKYHTQKYYASLMTAYHEYIYANEIYVNVDVISTLNKYDALQLYVYFKDKRNIFHPAVRLEMSYAIEMNLCSPTTYELFGGTLSFASFP